MAAIARTAEMELPSQQYRIQINPGSFIHDIFEYDIVEPHAKILNHFEQAQETLDLAPRGCGKTRIGNIGYSAWLAANNPNTRILIVSDTDTHAVRFLSTVKAALESHPLIKHFYGDLKGAKWTDHELVLKTRTDKTLTEATISAMGAYSGQVTGSHFEIIIADDIANFDNSRTENQRERMKEWFKTSLMPTLMPGGEFRVLGTRYHFSDLYDCLENELGFDTQIQQAIKEDGTSIWEWHMPLHTIERNGKKIKGLIEIRDGDEYGSGIGTLIFNLQYQNDIELMKKGEIFNYDWFIFTDDIPTNLRVYQGVDLAISKANTAAFFVILTLGIAEDGKIYVLDIYRERGVSFNNQGNLIEKKAKEWKPLRIGIETVAYQEALAQELQRLTLLPIIKLPTSIDKTMRAHLRSGLAESGRIHVRTHMHTFVSELVLMPDSKFKDQFDAFDFALEVARIGGGATIPASKMSAGRGPLPGFHVDGIPHF